MEEKEFYLEKLDFWEKLSEKEKDTVRNNCVMREYKKGQIIHGGERECLGMITVISGETRTCIISEEGREVTLFRLYEGDSCVLSASCVIDEITFETLVIAQQDTKLLIITAGAFASGLRQYVQQYNGRVCRKIVHLRQALSYKYGDFAQTDINPNLTKKSPTVKP